MHMKQNVSQEVKELIKRMAKEKSWDTLKKLSNQDGFPQNEASYSEVYELTEDLVVKVYNEEAYQRDIEEGFDIMYDHEVLLSLEHTGLVPIIYAWEENHFVVMEKINAPTFFDMVREDPLPENYEQDERYKRITKGLEKIVQEGWVPVDLKPFHLFFTSNDQIKVIDFTMYMKHENDRIALDNCIEGLNAYIEDYLV